MIDRHPTESELNDHVDGLLDAVASEDVRRHLAACAACRLEEQGLRALLARAAALPPIPPARELLPAIHAAATASRPVRIPTWLAIAASLVVILGAAVLWMGREPAVLSSNENTAAVAELLEAEREFVAATRKLLELLHERQRQQLLSAETVAAVERDLASLDRAIGEAREADGHELVALYQKKAEILWTVSKLAS